MEVIIKDSQDEASELVAKRIKNVLHSKGKPVLGLATGQTPLGVYKALVRFYEKGEIDFSKTVTFNLDEYVGGAPEAKTSYYAYMHNHLFSAVNIKPENTFIPNGMAENIDEECRRYEKAIKEKGPIDLQILGIGRDGHIGFNEPDMLKENSPLAR